MIRTKKAENTITLGTKVSKELDDSVVKYCSENNISKSEFVRDAVDHYIYHLANQQSYELIDSFISKLVNYVNNNSDKFSKEVLDASKELEKYFN